MIYSISELVLMVPSAKEEEMPTANGLAVQGGDRHRDITPENTLLTRLEQVVDWYADISGKPKHLAMTTAIDGLVRRKSILDQAPHEATPHRRAIMSS